MASAVCFWMMTRRFVPPHYLFASPFFSKPHIVSLATSPRSRCVLLIHPRAYKDVVCSGYILAFSALCRTPCYLSKHGYRVLLSVRKILGPRGMTWLRYTPHFAPSSPEIHLWVRKQIYTSIRTLYLYYSHASLAAVSWALCRRCSCRVWVRGYVAVVRSTHRLM